MSAGVSLSGPVPIPHLEAIRRGALIAAAVGLGISLLAGITMRQDLLPAYLVAFMFWAGIAIGSIGLLLVNNITGGYWGLLVRRPLESAAMTIVPMAILFVPIALGLETLYPWCQPEAVHEHPAITKMGYLTRGAFLFRSGTGFLIWIGLASLLWRGAIVRRADGSSGRSDWLTRYSPPGLVVFFLTTTFLAIDWGMSLEPEWYSSIYGVMVMIGWGLLTFSTMLMISAGLRHTHPYSEAATPSRIQDLGNLMLAFVMLWAYMSFSQFLIIWAGNLSEEIPWYLRRIRGGWKWVAISLVAFHFFAPFFALLFRDVKRKIGLLVFVAAAIAFMHLVDLSWLVLPASYVIVSEGVPQIPWVKVLLVPVAWFGIGGVSVFSFLYFLVQRPLVPDELLVNRMPVHQSGS